MLLNYWLAMRTSSEVPIPEIPPSKVFDMFRTDTQMPTVSRSVHAVMSDVKQDLANYRRFEIGPRTPEEEQFYYRTNVMQAGVLTPVLAAVAFGRTQSLV